MQFLIYYLQIHDEISLLMSDPSKSLMTFHLKLMGSKPIYLRPSSIVRIWKLHVIIGETNLSLYQGKPTTISWDTVLQLALTFQFKV